MTKKATKKKVTKKAATKKKVVAKKKSAAKKKVVAKISGDLTLKTEYMGYRAGTRKGSMRKYYDTHKNLDRQGFIQICVDKYKLKTTTASNWWNEFKNIKVKATPAKAKKAA